MSQAPTPALPAENQTNGLAIAGFVIALVGLVSGGLLSPIGLILSLVALGRQPRGFAVAGTIIGLVGSCGVILMLVVLLVGGVFMLSAGLVALGISSAFLFDEAKLETTGEMVTLAAAVESYQRTEGMLPDRLEVLDDVDGDDLLDHWGTPYRLRITSEEPGYDFESAGPDGAFDTDDDVLFSRLGEMWGVEDGRIDVRSREDSDSVAITFGPLVIEMVDSERGGGGGRLTITRNGRTIVDLRDDDGDGRGSVRIGEEDGAAPEPMRLPDAPTAPDAPVAPDVPGADGDHGDDG